MARKKAEIIAAKLNELFGESLKIDTKKKFDIEIESNFNIIVMRLITTRVDEKDFTQEEMDFIKAYSDGYEKAMLIVEQTT